MADTPYINHYNDYQLDDYIYPNNSQNNEYINNYQATEEEESDDGNFNYNLHNLNRKDCAKNPNNNENLLGLQNSNVNLGREKMQNITYSNLNDRAFTNKNRPNVNYDSIHALSKNSLSYSDERENNLLKSSLNSNNLNANLDRLLENLKNQSQDIEGKNAENSKLKQENIILMDTVNDLEAKCVNLRDENERLCKKIEEYQVSNKEWEKTVVQINLSLNNIEENNQTLKNENENLRNYLNELELKLNYHSQKENKFDENALKLKSIQEDYEKSVKELKMKQEELKIKFENREKELFEELGKKEKEYLNNLDEINYEKKKIKRESEDLINEIKELKDRIRKGEEFLFQKEKEFIDQAQKKDTKLIELEKSLKIVSEEYEYEILKLNKTITEKETVIISQKNQAKESENYQKELLEAHNLLNEFQTECEFYKSKADEFEQFRNDYETKINYFESEMKNLVEIITTKDKILAEYDEKYKELNINYSSIINDKNSEKVLSENQINSLKNEIKEKESIMEQLVQKIAEVEQMLEICNIRNERVISSNRNFKYLNENENYQEQNNKLFEELRKKDKIILILEKKIDDLRKINKTCYDLLGQLTF